MARMNILLGVTGSIAAYKTPELIRRLKERGAGVQVVLTRSAREFVTETSLQAVSDRPVRDNLWDKEAEAAMGHIELARWADLVLIAPATAEIMSRLVTGAAGDLLTTICLATEAPVAIAPAMNHVMWGKPAVQANRALLEQRGVRILGPDHGDQACGETGEGRMLEPEEIATLVTGPTAVAEAVPPPLVGKTVMVTAGPTREAIDPVRFISNRSSGKMGYALAAAAADAGATVILISGPVSLDTPEHVVRIDVETAEDMLESTQQHVDDVDIFIGAAAVADYRSASVRKNKIKKKNEQMTVEFVKAPDVLLSVASIEGGPFTVGFAAETEKVGEYAKAKLAKKNLDMIVANKVGADRGFDRDDNAVDVYWETGEESFPLSSKRDLAVQLIRLITDRYNESGRAGAKASVVNIRD